MNMQFEQLNREDTLAPFRNEFHIPKLNDREDQIYLLGNSLGLQPKLTQKIINDELEAWQQKGLNGYFTGENPWYTYHDLVNKTMANIVGAQTKEVVVMNSLSVNLHFMMASFYRPTKERHKILIEEHVFPSDHYAVVSQMQLHGYNPEDSLLIVSPREGEEIIHMEDVLETIDKEGPSIALVLLPGVHYYTGQVYDMKTITEAGQAQGCRVDFDLAHAAGNIPLSLHDWNMDFACWCNYKNLNSGPSSVASCFIHDDRLTEGGIACDWRNPNIIRLAAAPLYNSFQDVYRFVEVLKSTIKN
jgi:kynureninase